MNVSRSYSEDGGGEEKGHRGQRRTGALLLPIKSSSPNPAIQSRGCQDSKPKREAHRGGGQGDDPPGRKPRSRKNTSDRSTEG